MSLLPFSTNSPGHIQSYMRSKSNSTFEALASRQQIMRVIRVLASADFFIIGGGVPYFRTRSK